MAEPTWRSVLGELMRGRPIGSDQTAWAMDQIMQGEATAAQLAAFAVLLHAKGETADELAGLARTMLDRAPVVSVDKPAVDVVGTGGDSAHTVNISTMAAVVTAGTGRTVVKHGNRAASSRCGAADVLEALGVVIALPAEDVARCATEAGIGFCFAQVFHAGLRHAGGPRRELGVATAFNVLGPLTNPARPVAAAVGCADRAMAPVMAEVLAGRGGSALVFRGDDGLDELTTATTSQVWVAAGGTVRNAVLDPSRFGIDAPPADALVGGDAAYNAEVARETLDGRSGPVRDAVLLNAAAAIAAFDAATAGDGTVDLDSAIEQGLQEAARAVDSGAAAATLQRWVELSQSLAS
ncbi:MAG: anthranilate phosphoribosyltransferase [bacterium]